MNGPRRLLLAGLVVLLTLVIAKALLGTVLIGPRLGVDLEIPLRAADRWLAGEPPYLASAFTSPPGATQPFLYPPYTLPFFAILTAAPRVPLEVIAAGLMLAASIVAGRRLAIPWVWLPLVLVWPPFAEGIFGANIQMLLFAAFAFLFYARGGEPWLPRPREVADPAESGVLIGGLATLVGSIKVSQLQPWIYVLHHRPRAAIGGAIAIVLVAAVTLPLTGIGVWFDWIDQLRLASDPTWDLGGFALTRLFPSAVSIVIAVVCLIAVWFVPRRDAGAWVGLLSVIGALSLHVFGLVFLVPAMLVIRRELALIAAICIATYSYEGAWAGILLVTVAFALKTRSASMPRPSDRPLSAA